MPGTFPILIELDENASLKTLALLHRMPGIAKIHFSFDAFDKPKRSGQLLLAGPNGSERAPRENINDGFNVTEAVLALMRERGIPLTRKQILEFGGVNGRRMVNGIASMVKAGHLKKVAPATYALATYAASGKKHAQTIDARAGKPSGIEAAFAAIDQGGTLSKKQIGEAVKKHGYSYKSVGDFITKLVKAKRIKKVSRGNYSLA